MVQAAHDVDLVVEVAVLLLLNQLVLTLKFHCVKIGVWEILLFGIAWVFVGAGGGRGIVHNNVFGVGFALASSYFAECSGAKFLKINKITGVVGLNLYFLHYNIKGKSISF